jgi:hypothetical protein
MEAKIAMWAFTALNSTATLKPVPSLVLPLRRRLPSQLGRRLQRQPPRTLERQRQPPPTVTLFILIRRQLHQ